MPPQKAKHVHSYIYMVHCGHDFPHLSHFWFTDHYLNAGKLPGDSSLFSCACIQQCSIICKVPLLNGYCWTHQICVFFVHDHVCTTGVLCRYFPHMLALQMSCIESKDNLVRGIASHTFLLGLVSPHTGQSGQAYSCRLLNVLTKQPVRLTTAQNKLCLFTRRKASRVDGV